MKWEAFSSRRIAEVPRDSVCVLPLGSVEQHGPHLPLMTDILIAETLADRLDEACGGRLLVMPAPRIGCSDHHRNYCGTLTLRHETFSSVMMEILAAGVHHGFRRFLLLNAHGGNSAICGVMLSQAAGRWPDAEVIFTSWYQAAAERLRPLVEGDYPAVGHAGEFETSLMLALRPELVDLSVAEDDGIAAPAPQLRSDLFSSGTASRSVPFDRLTRTGAWGKPSLASAKKGHQILDIALAALKKLLVDCWPDAPGMPGGSGT